MKVYALPSYRRAAKKLPEDVRELALSLARRLPKVFGRPHLHSGMGIKQIGRYYEFRVGLDMRVLFLIDSGDAVLTTIGNHDQIRAYLKSR